MNNKLVSVIIPTYNREKMLCECVDSVLQSTYAYIEIIIVDNHSTDLTVDTVKKKYFDAPVKVVELEENLMAAGGRNEGIKRASGDYLLFIDNDNVIFSDMIQILVDEMEKDNKTGLVGPLSINRYYGDTIWLASGDYNFFTSRPKMLFPGKKIDEVKLERVYETCYSPNIMMVSREVINTIGGFDNTYYAMYEEADFGYRILKAGYKCYIVTDARTNHMSYIGNDEQSKLRTLGIGFPERAYHYAKNRFVFMKKYAKWYQRIVFYMAFMHVFFVYYIFMALLYGRRDIAGAWLKGTCKGLFSKVSKNVNLVI